MVDRFLQLWRGVLVGGDLTSGCAVAAVTVDAQGEDPALATTVIAGVEGALILSRARHDVTAFDAVAGQLVQLARAASAPSAG